MCIKSAIIIALIFLVTGIGLGQDTGNGMPGREEFQINCLPCHPNGNNVIRPDKPMKTSKKLTDFKLFLSWIRNPIEPMTPFPPSRISDKQAGDLYNYIVMASKNEWK